MTLHGDSARKEASGALPLLRADLYSTARELNIARNFASPDFASTVFWTLSPRFWHYASHSDIKDELPRIFLTRI